MTARGPAIQTHSGVAFYPLAPRPEDVRLGDIAHHLALQNRFSGATRCPYSVAEHSVRVMRLVEEWGRSDLALSALMHDSAEAYVVDVPSPIKRHESMAWYRETEARVMAAICERFGIAFAGTIDPIVKRADLVLLATERRDLMCESDVEWGPLPDPLPHRIEPQDWRNAKADFAYFFASRSER